MRFNVALAFPWGNECFEEIIRSIASGLRELGHEVTTEKRYLNCTNIIVGYYLQLKPVANGFRHHPAPPKGSIIYQLEPYSPETVSKEHIPIEAMKSYTVWDYSRYNVASLKEHGINAVYVAAGSYPGMTHVIPAQQDIDVLFYGGLHGRRKVIFEELKQRGLKVCTAYSVWQEERAKLIARAKVVINIHGEDNYHSFESMRVAYLLASRKAVVTEVNSGDDTDGFENSALCVPYRSLTDACVYLVNNADRRHELEVAGYAYMQTRQMKDILKVALESA